MKNDIFKPVAALVCICLAVTALLAYINSVTAPIIKSADEKAASQARVEVLPEAKGFKLMKTDKLPECVTEVYKAENGAGYVFMLTVKGYGGDMNLICGINSDGKIEKTKTLTHSETSGLGSKTAEEPYKKQYVGKTEDSLKEVDAISGATISSTAYMKAIKDAFKAYNQVKEAG